MKLDSQVVGKGFNLLSNQEYRFAKNLADLDEKYFEQSFLQNLPKQISSQNLKDLSPSQEEFVFFRVNQSQPEFSYKENDEMYFFYFHIVFFHLIFKLAEYFFSRFEFPLQEGEQWLMKCKYVSDLIWNGKVSLI